MSRLMEVRKKDYLLVLVLLVTQTKINSCFLWPRVIGYYFTLEVPRVININFLQQFQYIRKRKGHENNVTK